MIIKIQIVMKKIIGTLIILIFTVLALTSCYKKQNGDVISREFKSEQWGRFDYLEADFDVVKAPMTADLVMDIVVSEVFPNVYQYYNDDDGVFPIVLSINGPDGSRRVREFRFKLKDKEGHFKSEKVNGYYHYSLPLLNEMRFSEVGKYHFKIENKYPKDPMYGIKSLNVSCLQIKRF